MRSLTDQERQKFFTDKHIGVLSVAAEGGRPPASVPIWYDLTPDGNITISTGASSRKARLIKQAGAITLVVQREDPPYRYVIMEGTVVDATTPTPPQMQEAVAIRYLGEEGGRAFAEKMRAGTSTLFTVRPDRWITSDFSEDI